MGVTSRFTANSLKQNLMIQWLRLVRFPNLIIVAITQYMLAALILYPPLAAAEITPLLDSFHFFLLVLVTVLIAAGGYVINDIEDLEIDKKNNPGGHIVGLSISLEAAQLFYYIIVFAGFCLAFYIARHIQNIPLVFIYPVATILLYWYSKALKKSVLWGNIVVAMFCAFVAGILWFAERAAYQQLEQFPELHQEFTFLFLVYMGFAFISTLFRELIKDIEDRVGDAAEDCRTFPIIYGLKKSKYLGYLYGLLLISLLISFFQFLVDKEAFIALIVSIIMVLMPLIWTLIRLQRADMKADFTQLSKLAKFIMLGGLLMLMVMKISC